MKIISLVENTTRRKDLRVSHGLSLYLEHEGHCVLFDCGSNEDYLYNANRLGVDLRRVEAVVLSHNHYDHACGMFSFPFACKTYVGETFFCDRYTKVNEHIRTYTASGLQESDLDCCVVDDYLKIMPGVFVVGGFKGERYDLRYIRNGSVDHFEDEIALVVKSSKGLVVLVGCSHCGVLNIVQKVRDLFEEPIYALLGGAHLKHVSDEELCDTIARLQDIEVLGLCHCSGEIGDGFKCGDVFEV